MEANKHVLMDRDDLRLAAEQAELKVTLEGNEKAIQAFARDKLGAHIVLWGRAKRTEGTRFLLHVRAMDTSGEPAPYLDERHECRNFADVANFYTSFEDILLKKRTTLRTLKPVSAADKARKRRAPSAQHPLSRLPCSPSTALLPQSDATPPLLPFQKHSAACISSDSHEPKQSTGLNKNLRALWDRRNSLDHRC